MGYLLIQLMMFLMANWNLDFLVALQYNQNANIGIAIAEAFAKAFALLLFLVFAFFVVIIIGIINFIFLGLYKFPKKMILGMLIFIITSIIVISLISGQNKVDDQNNINVSPLLCLTPYLILFFMYFFVNFREKGFNASFILYILRLTGMLSFFSGLALLAISFIAFILTLLSSFSVLTLLSFFVVLIISIFNTYFGYLSLKER